jgi:hypothetical protein
MIICTRELAASPTTPVCAWRAPSMNAYVLIAGLSGVAVFCAVALKGFGAPR